MRTSHRPHQVTLQRALSKLGVCSRSQASPLIQAGRVSINGRVEANPNRWMNLQSDKIAVDGRMLTKEKEYRYLLFHKPLGVVTTRSDERGRVTVFDLLGDSGKGLFPVGRLDKDTTGLLLLTNDHQLSEMLTNPNSKVPKSYSVVVDRPLTERDLKALKEGVEIDIRGTGYKTRHAEVSKINPTTIEVTITEGKNRQLRRMLDALGYEVVLLHRKSVGTLQLEKLKEGDSRELTSNELKSLKAQQSPPARETSRIPVRGRMSKKIRSNAQHRQHHR